MVDVASVTAIINGLKTATDIAKLLKESKLSLEKAEAEMKVAELISALADIKMEVADMRQEMINKDKQIQELQKALEAKKNLHYDKYYYWLGKGSDKEGPFCQACYDKEGKLSHLQPRGHGCWDCFICKNRVLEDDDLLPA